MTKKQQLSKKGKLRQKHTRDKEYTTWLHFKPCYVCQKYGVETHHINGRKFGTNDYEQIPLCSVHHRGEFSPHGRDADRFYQSYPKSELLEQAENYHKEYEDGQIITD